jgi:tetratricopeptide (TPR) repeat protein
MRRGLILLLTALPLLAPAQGLGQGKVIDLRGTRPSEGDSFDMLWFAYRKADLAGDRDTAARAFHEIRRLRIERNIPGLEEIGLALVESGQRRLAHGDVDRAIEDFRDATLVDSHLPDGYFGLSQAEARSGFWGIGVAVKDWLTAIGARLDTARGQYFLLSLLIPVGLLGAFAATLVAAVALLLRDGPLLLHDIEESVALLWSRGAALAIFGALLLLPTATFQGYGWLPLWWLALLFVYLETGDRLIVCLVFLGSLSVPLLVKTLDDRTQAVQNPTFRASMTALEGRVDAKTIDELEKASNRYPDDADLAYLLAFAYKKAGQYDEAAEIYRQMLEKDKNNGFALNNLGNIEFARGEYQAAIARYKQGVEGNPAPDLAATFNYNLNLAYLQRFEPEPAREARSEAERLGGSLVRAYDSLWSRDEGSAVVDIGMSRAQVWHKFEGMKTGVARKNLTGSPEPSWNASTLSSEFVGRFSGFLLVFALAVFLISRWRGSRAFTMRCLKCGTPFCKKCHLGVAIAGLCTQCHHLFVVRDGVSGPARNQKLLEVQSEDERRERLFRALSLVSPGAGHVYAQHTLPGLVLAFVWYATLALLVLAGRVLPVTEAPPSLSGDFGLYAGGILLAIVYVAANRARPDFEVAIPAPRRGTPRVR